MEPLVSVIIPVYNNQRELHTCINSVLKQSYQNMEIILVDDGSQDDSGNICADYATNDSRILVVHQNNQGPAVARNAALDICTGEFILFVDSDDWVEPDYILDMYQALKAYGADVVACNYNVYKEHVFSHRYSENEEVATFTGLEAVGAMWYGDRIDTGAPMKLFKRELWNKLRFPNCFAEDLAVMHYVLEQARRVVYIPQCLYSYRHRQASVTRAFAAKKYVMIEIAQDLITYGEAHPEVRAEASCKAVDACMHLVCQMPINPDTREYYDTAVSLVKRHRRTVLGDSRARKKTRYALLLSFFGFRVLRFVYRKIV